MLSSVFHWFGLFCTSHPWEVIVVVLTLTSAMTSVTFFGDLSDSKVCGWNYQCPEAQDILSSDVICLTIAKCLAVACIYLQFRQLDDLGSKWVLGILGLISIVSSVIFSAGFIHLYNFGYELYGLGDALPFFLLVWDLSKATKFARYAMITAMDDVSIRETVARGMAIFAPNLTLDTLVEVLVIGIGSFSGVPTLEMICRFGCVSLVVNYIVFMTFFPASVCLALEVIGERQSGFVIKGKKQNLLSDSNPVARRIKLIMSAGLALVHVYSRWTHVEHANSISSEEARRFVPQLPLWEFYIRGLFEFTPQQLITYGFAILLTLKYFLIDSRVKRNTCPNSTSVSSIRNGSFPNGKLRAEEHVTKVPDTTISDTLKPVKERKERLSCHRRRTFTVGEDDDEQADEMIVAEKFQKKLTPVLPDVPLIKLDPPASIPDVIQTPSINVPVGSAADKRKAFESMSDSEILQLVKSKQISAHKLEEELGDDIRAINIRRMLISATLPDPFAFSGIPYKEYDYSFVNGNCCENVLGYIPIPLGVAGPLLLDGKSYQVPLATTEGCLVASINRGCRAITLSGGARTVLHKDGMTRGPVVHFPTLYEAAEFENWIVADGFETVRQVFDRTSRFARLQSIKTRVVGNNVYLRFVSTTGDAMGMNMLCKGTEKALHAVQERFPHMQIVSLSGNYCIDKKPSALNWIEGRGKSVNCEAVISAEILKNILKTTAAELEQLNIDKNFIGSAMAGSIGGNNAHAANAVAAVFLATGQDIAQTVGSSMCLTRMERSQQNPDDLYISCTMPCVEVGTVGGGTNLPPQGACLKALGVQGSSTEHPSENAGVLARIICGTVLAAELNLMAALAAGQLVQSHLKHNRSKLDLAVPLHPNMHKRSNSLQA